MNIEIMNCPTCGAGLKPKLRECDYCGSVLIITSIENLGSSKIDSNLLNSSIEKWKEKLKTNPLDPDANYAIGMTYMNKNLREAAYKHFVIVVEQVPEFSLGHYNLAILLFDDGNVIINSDDFKLAQKHIEYAAMLDLVEAKGFKWFFSGLKLMNVDSNQSILDYKKAIETCPDIATFYNNLGFVYEGNSDFEEAVKYYKKTLELDVKYTRTYINLCNLYIKKNNYVEAEIYGKFAIESFKDFTPDSTKALAYNNYSNALWNLGKKEEAIKNIKIAISYDPSVELYKSNFEIYSKKSGCFIATATMGSYDHPTVMELRHFRDNWILQKSWGERFVKWYYHYGSIVAKFIENSFVLRKISYFLIVSPLFYLARIVKK
jgi:tetratricopeptide (TPR) repeat protein